MGRNETEIVDNPASWVNEHIRRYVESDGRNGHEWHGVKTLLLTTEGRKSGLLRRTPLIYDTDGDRYLVVASKGGAATHPAWYLNLLDNPNVQVQVGAEKFAGRARPATAEEKPRLWRSMVELWPDYAKYQAKTSRDIPVVVIERG